MSLSVDALEGTPSQAAQCPAVGKCATIHILLIIAIWLLLYVPGMFTPALLDDADSVHAEGAREMLLRHDWSTMYINGFRYLEKAPLPYWGMCVSFKVFGVADWSARVPLVLGILGALLSVYGLGRRFFNESTGFYSAVILGLSFGPYIFSRILIPDIVVGMWLTTTCYCFLRALEEDRPSFLSCCGIAVSAAMCVLTKGLIGIVFPIGIIVVYLFLTRNLKLLLRMRLVSSFLVFLAVAAPWHIVAGLRNPAAGQSRGFFWFYFINEQVLRYLNKRYPVDYDTVPFWVFWCTLLIWLGPWTAFLFKGLAKVPWRWSELPRLDRTGRAMLVCAIWSLLIYGFFSFSSRQEYYVLPALPAIALMMAAWMAQEQASPVGSSERRAGIRGSVVLLVIAAVAGVAAVVLLITSKSVPVGTELADVLSKNDSEYALSFGHIFDLTGMAMGFFRWPLAITAISLLGGSIANLLLRKRGQVARANFALALMMLVFLHCAHKGLVIFEPILSSKALSNEIAKVYQPGDVVVINGVYEDASTLNFYGHLPLHVLNARGLGNLYYGSLFPDSPQAFEDDASLMAMWSGPKRVFLWTEEKKIPKYIQNSGYTLLTKSGGKLILMNRPLARVGQLRSSGEAR